MELVIHRGLLYQRGELHTTSKLYTGELHASISIHSEKQ
jgi:hypothetical protein